MTSSSPIRQSSAKGIDEKVVNAAPACSATTGLSSTDFAGTFAPAAGAELDQLLSRAVASAGAMNALSEVWK
jgi:hypothetical protein